MLLTEPKHPPRSGPPSARYEVGRGNILAEALLERGHEPVMWWDHPEGDLVDVEPDLVSLRSSLPIQIARARSFEADGVPCINAPSAHVAASDKLAQAVAMEAAGVPHIETHGDGGGWEPSGVVVVKPRIGSSGHGVRLADSGSLARQADELVQRFVPAALELRCTVVDGRPFGWSRRRPKVGDFRANLAQGGTMETVDGPEAAGEIAAEAVRLLGLEIAGVDLLIEEGEAKILEINAATTLHGPTPQSTADVLAAVIDLFEVTT